MATTYWTLENVGVSGGDEKPMADWGLDDATATFVSQAEDQVTLSALGRAFDAAYLFPYQSTVIIRRDRVRALNGTYSGGTFYFTGLVAYPHVGGTSRTEFQQCAIVGPWWYLNERGFEQQYKEILSITNGVVTYKSPNPTKSRIFLNLALGEYGQVTVTKLNTGQQLTEILNWALKPFTDTATAAPFQIGAIGIAVDAPVDEVKNITCAEAARKMLRWSPDAVAWFDHATSPPTFHVKRRSALAQFNLDITADGQMPTSLSIKPRFDLQRPYVRIQYERTNTDNGVALSETVEDLWPNPAPTGALNQFAGVPFVIDLRGYTRTTTASVAIKTTTIASASLEWWLLNDPAYKRARDEGRVISITIDPESVQFTPALGEDNLSLPNQLLEGSPSDSITVGGNAARWQRLSVTCKARVTTIGGGVIPEKTFSFQVTTTDASTGTYGGGSSVDNGDPIPVNLARDFHEAVAHLPFEGSLSFTQREVGSLPRLGHKLNILGSANAAWATMATVVQRVTENIQRGATTVEIGMPPHLAVDDLVSLLRVSRNRDPQNPYSLRVGGGGGGGTGGGLVGHSAWQNTSQADGTWEKQVASSGNTKKIRHDAVTVTSDWIASGTSCSIALSHITGKQAYFQEFRWLDRSQNCKEYRAWFLMTEPEEIV